MQKKTLNELADEYYESIALHQQLIDSKRKRLNEAKRCGKTHEVYMLNRYLKLLYEQKRELEDTAVHLKHYYRFSVTNKP